MLKAHFTSPTFQTFIPHNVISLKEHVSFTKREYEIIAQLKKGLSAKRIGLNLCISNRTVEKHIENIKHKLKCKNRIEIITLV